MGRIWDDIDRHIAEKQEAKAPRFEKRVLAAVCDWLTDNEYETLMAPGERLHEVFPDFPAHLAARRAKWTPEKLLLDPLKVEAVRVFRELRAEVSADQGLASAEAQLALAVPAASGARLWVLHTLVGVPQRLEGAQLRISTINGVVIFCPFFDLLAGVWELQGRL